MKVSDSEQIPHGSLRPFLGLWKAQCHGRPWPQREDITLDDLRSAAANSMFCRIERPYQGLDSIRLVNVGSAIERATAQHLSGLTVGQLLRELGSSPEFTRCFSEYGLAATEGCCSYNEGLFPWQRRDWLAYRRLVMPLGKGSEPDGLFVVIDLNAEGLGLALPETLSEYNDAEATPSQPWAVPPLQLEPGSRIGLQD